MSILERIEEMKGLGLNEEQIAYLLEMDNPVVDCRSYEGITIGLVDSIITICRILAVRDLITDLNVQEALSDLAQDEDVELVMSLARGAVPSGTSNDKPTPLAAWLTEGGAAASP